MLVFRTTFAERLHNIKSRDVMTARLFRAIPVQITVKWSETQQLPTSTIVCMPRRNTDVATS
jgi:hypothetical protein